MHFLHFSLAFANFYNLHITDLEADQFKNVLTIYRFDIYDGLDKIEADISNIDFMNSSITDSTNYLNYPAFQRIYFKHRDRIWISDLLYDNKPFVEMNNPMLELLAKLNTLLIKKEPVVKFTSKNSECEIIFAYNDMLPYNSKIALLFENEYIFKGKTRSDYFEHISKVILGIYKDLLDNKKNFKLEKELLKNEETKFFRLKHMPNLQVKRACRFLQSKLVLSKKQMEILHFITSNY